MNVNIGKHIYQTLKAINGLTVYPVVAAFDTDTPTTPFAVYRRTGIDVEYSKDLFTGIVKQRFEVTIADNDYATVSDLAQQAVNELLGMSYSVKTPDLSIGQVHINDLNDDFIDGLFIENITIEINTTTK